MSYSSRSLRLLAYLAVGAGIVMGLATCLVGAFLVIQSRTGAARLADGSYTLLLGLGMLLCGGFFALTSILGGIAIKNVLQTAQRSAASPVSTAQDKKG